MESRRKYVRKKGKEGYAQAAHDKGTAAATGKNKRVQFRNGRQSGEGVLRRTVFYVESFLIAGRKENGPDVIDAVPNPVRFYSEIWEANSVTSVYL